MTFKSRFFVCLAVMVWLAAGLPAWAASQGSLVGSGDSSNLVRDLTAEGSIDWVYWYNTPVEHKSGGGQIGSLTSSGGTASHCANDLRGLTWSDGTTTPISASGAGAGLCIGGIGSRFSFTAPADATSRTLIVHVGGVSSGATLTAHLSDGSAADWTDTVPSTASTWDRNYMLTYNAGGGGQTLTVTWTMQSAIGAGTVSVSAAALRPAGSPFFYTGKVATQSSPNTMVLNGNLLYSCELKVVSVVDMSDPASPSLVTTVPSTNAFNNDNNVFCSLQRNSLVAFAENNAGANGNGFLYFDLSNPRSPQIKTATKINKTVDEEPVYNANTAFIPSIAYRSFGGAVTAQYGDLVSVDVTNLDRPAVAGALEQQVDASYGGAYNMFGATPVNNQTLYVATTSATGDTTKTGNNGLGELLVVDVSNPAAMSVLKTVSVPGTVHLYRPLIQGNLAVAVGDSAGWQGIYYGGNLEVVTFDITNPRSPAILGTVATNVAPFTRTPMASAAIGTNLFLFAGKDSKNNTVLMQVDTTDPVHPKTANFLVPYGAQYLAVYGTVLYVSADPNYLNGITTFSLPKPISGGTSGGGTCTFTLGASSYAAAATAGQSSVTVTTQSGCAWTATSNASWITITAGSSGTSGGTVSFTFTANSAASQRTGTLTVAGQTFTVTQAAGAACTYSITPINAYVAYSGGTGTVTVTAGTGCAWTAASGATWITITAGSSGTGNGTVSYSVGANTATTERTGTLTIAGQSFPVTEDGVPPACTYSISPTTAPAVAGGGAGTVTVTAGTGCAWTATSGAAWISISAGTSGTGNGTVSYTVAANSSSNSRSGTITIAGQTFTVTQAAASGSGSADVVLKVDGGTFARTMGFAQGLPHIYFANRLTPPGYPATLKNVQIYFGNRSTGLPLNFPITVAWATVAGGGSTIKVTLTSLAATVDALGSFNTYAVTPLTINSGDFFVGFGVDNPAGIYPADMDTDTPSQQRSYYSSDGSGFGLLDAANLPGNLAIRATVTVPSGVACTYSLSPTSATLQSSSYSGVVGVSTGSGCPWTATSNDASWLTISSGASGTGPGTVNYATTNNNSTSPRTGTLTIAGQTFTVIQLGAACTYGVQGASIPTGAAGGTGSLTVVCPSGCAWTMTSNVSWLTILSGSPGNGNGTVQVSVAPNTSTSPRTGTLSVAGSTVFTVNQDAAVSSTGPLIADGGVVNAADYTANFAPGMIISLFGSNFATATTNASTIPLPNSLAGVSVEVVDGSQVLNAPLFFVSQLQINAQLPFNMTSSSVQVRVRNAQGVSGTQTITITPRCPRLFTQTQDGKGDAVVVHADYSVVTANSPGAPGETLMLFLTGLGAVSPSIAAGQAGGDGSAGKPLNLVTDPVTVTVGSTAATVSFKGLAPNYAGLYQINFQVPNSPVYGSETIIVSAGNQSSQSTAMLSVGMKQTSLGSGTVGPAGGTVSAGGTSITVPAGILTALTQIAISKGAGPTAFDDKRISDIYTATGVPLAQNSPITLTIDLASPPPNPNEVFMVVQVGGEGAPPLLLKGQVAGARVMANLPDATAGQNAAATLPALTYSNLKVLFFAISRFTLAASPSGHFSVACSTSLSPATVMGYLDAAYSLADQAALLAGAPGATRDPIRVNIVPGSLREPWGQTIQFYGNALDISEDLITGTTPAADVKPKIMHMFMHYVLNTWDPRPPVADVTFRAEPWAWLDEAIATWSERIFDTTYIPQQALQNADFLTKHGLEYPASTPTSLPLARNHGAGASMFLEYLMWGGPSRQVPSTDSARLGSISGLLAYRVKGSQTGFLYLPVEALGLWHSSLAQDWQDFSTVYIGGNMIYKQPSGQPLPVKAPNQENWSQYVAGDLAAANLAVLDPGPAAPVTFQWDAPDLSARFYLVKFTGEWKQATPEVAVTLTYSAGAVAAKLYQVPQDYSQIGSLVGVVSGSTSVVTDKSFTGSANNLLITVVNYQMLKPFDNLSHLTLKVEPRVAPCTYSINPTSYSASWGQGSSTVDVTTQSGCAWTAAVQGDAAWLHITSGASGTGSGTVAYWFEGNPGAARSATMLIAGIVFTLNQAAYVPTPPPPAYLPRTIGFTFSGAPTGTISVGGADVPKVTWEGYSFKLVTLPDWSKPGYWESYDLSGTFSSDFSTLIGGTFEVTQRYNSISPAADRITIYVSGMPCAANITMWGIQCPLNTAVPSSLYTWSYTYQVLNALGYILSETTKSFSGAVSISLSF